MATVFWDSHGVILIDYLQKGKTITRAYYASLLDKLKAELAERRSHLQKNNILFHKDNAPSRTSAVAMAKIHELQFELLDHPPHSPDLAPSEFFLFPHLKIALGGQEKRRVLFGRVTEMGAPLGEVCRVTRRLC